MQPTSPLVWAHPAMAAVTILLAFIVFRQGMHLRAQRLRRVPAPAGSGVRHLKLGPWSVALMVASAIGGIGSAVLLRQMKPLDSFHGWLGTVSAAAFVAQWLLGRQLSAGKKSLAQPHGIIGLLAMFAAGITGILGISMLP